MTSVTTDFPRPLTSRSRTDRHADGVVASYIHSLAGAWTGPRQHRAVPALSAFDASPAVAAGDVEDAQAHTLPAAVRVIASSARRNPCWKPGRRAGFRPARALEAQ
jgi:hypothetical protein